MTGPKTTLLQLLQDRARETPNSPAMCFRRRGIWQELTWRDYLARVSAYAQRLHALGMKPGDTIALIGEATPEWLIADASIAAVGAVSVTPYPDAPEEELRSALDSTNVKLAIFEGAPRYSGSACGAPQTLRLRREPGLPGEALDDVPATETIFSNQIDSDASTIAFTAGASGKSRPIRLSHAVLVERGHLFGKLAAAQRNTTFCQVPFAHVSERVCSQVHHLLTGGVLYFPERVDTVSDDLHQASPGQFSALAWQWDQLAQRTIIKMRDARASTRRNFEQLMESGSAGVVGLLMRRSLRRQLGFSKDMRLICHGDSVKPSTERFFAALSMPLLSGFGMTETGGWALYRSGEGPWRPLSDAHVRLDEKGELFSLHDGQSISIGERAIKSEGGYKFDLPLDENVAIERKAMRVELVNHARVSHTGAGTILTVSLNEAVAVHWARKEGENYSGLASLALNPKLAAFLCQQLQTLLGAPIKVEILPRALERERGELTPTGRMRVLPTSARTMEVTNELSA